MQFFGNLPFPACDHVFYQFARRAEIRFFQRGIRSNGANFVRHRADIPLFHAEPAGAGAVKPFGINAQTIARQTGGLLNARDGADLVQVLYFGNFFIRFLFGDKYEFPVGIRPLDRGKRKPPPRVERNARVGKNDLRPQGNYG